MLVVKGIFVAPSPLTGSDYKIFLRIRHEKVGRFNEKKRKAPLSNHQNNSHVHYEVTNLCFVVNLK